MRKTSKNSREIFPIWIRRKIPKRKRRINQEDFKPSVRTRTVSSVIDHRSLGLSAPVFKAIMKRGYKVPTPIQRKVGWAVVGCLLIGVFRLGYSGYIEE